MRFAISLLLVSTSALAAGYPDPFAARRGPIASLVETAAKPGTLVRGAPFGERHGVDSSRFFGLVLSQKAFNVGLFSLPDGDVQFGLVVGPGVFDPSSPDNSSSRGRSVPRGSLPPGSGAMRAVKLAGGELYFGELERGLPQGFGFRLAPSARPGEWTAHVGGFRAGKPDGFGYRVTRGEGPVDDIHEGEFSNGEPGRVEHWRLGVACEMPVDDPGTAVRVAAAKPVVRSRGIGDKPSSEEAAALLKERFAKMGAPVEKHSALGPGDVVQLENKKYYIVSGTANEEGVPLLGGRILYLPMAFRKLTGQDVTLAIESYGSYNPKKGSMAAVMQAIERQNASPSRVSSYSGSGRTWQAPTRPGNAGFVPMPVDTGPKPWESRYRVQEMIRSPEKTFQNRYSY